MKLNVISTMRTVVAILAVILLSLSFYLLRKKKNSSRINVIGNPNPTTPMATTSIVHPPSQNFEVFLNFRGADTRKTFTDHLYHRLVDVRVCVFRDNEELHVGKEIHPNLLAAIQTSKISVPIISPDYASSQWCLLELVQILKCRETLGQIVIPIFYHVDPSDVRHQKGSFGRAFSLHKKNHSREIVQEWRDALKKVASLKALELNNNVDEYEGKLVKQVVEMVLTNLRKPIIAVPEYLVGVEERAKAIMDMVDVKSSTEVQIVLIHGMGGIGKTTLAKFLYNKLTSHFQFCSFLESVRETSMQQLQKQLISNILKKDWPRDIYPVDEGTCIINNTFKGTKVLLVLDDVDNGDQLTALMGRHDWLEVGSIIIITSRNRDILNPWHAKLFYELRELDFVQSFQLFCKHALQREDSGCGEFETIAQDIVATTGGLPLAIVVIGSFLLGKDLDIWKEILKKLKRVPDDKVQSKLKITYDALTKEQKKIFLDIACLFPYIHELKYFMYMWDDCEYYPRSGIEILTSLSLIKVRLGNELIMHDQLRQLGREIVRQQGRDLPGKRSILWNQEEAYEVLEGNQGTDRIEVLNLAMDRRSQENCFRSRQFERLTKLRYLQMKNVNLVGNFKSCFLNLRWLQWYGCPSNYRAAGFCPKNLVVLNLSKSNITEHWGGWKEMKVISQCILNLSSFLYNKKKIRNHFTYHPYLQYAEKLKVLKLRKCSKLKATPDFSAFKKLEILDISFCKSLVRIHPSICRLAKTLKTLGVGGCEKLQDLPKEMGKMEELRELYLSRTSIRQIPIVEGFMTKLNTLFAMNCRKLSWLPDSIGSLTKLQVLIMSGCKSLAMIPETIGKAESLFQLDLRDTNIKNLPDSIGNLHKLRGFMISKTPMERLPAAIGMLKELQTFDAKAIHGLPEVPKEIGELTRLRELNLDGTPISVLPKLPSDLMHLGFSGCSMESLPNVSYLINLDSLTLRDMGVIPEPPSSLETLSLCACQALHTLPKFSNLKYLSSLFLEDCTELVEINALEEVRSLRQLEIINCRKISKLSGLGKSLNKLWLFSCDELKGLPELSTFKNLTQFLVIECNNIVEIQGLDTLECVEELFILDCSSLERVSNFSHLTMLCQLGLGKCPKLRDNDFPCIDKFTSLELLCLLGGSPALKFPDFTKLRKLKRLGVNHFEELREIPKLQELKSLITLDVSGCKSLENLPDFSEFNDLRSLYAHGCEKLTEIRGLENLNSFYELDISGCRSLKQLPDFSEEMDETE